MKNYVAILWAFAAGVLNNHVLTATRPTSPPLSFRRGTDDIKLIHCDLETPGKATVETPDGGRETVQLADAELGQLVTNYGRATGQRIEMPPLVGYEQETTSRAAGVGGYGDIGQQ